MLLPTSCFKSKLKKCMLISACNLNFNGLKIKDKLKGENKSKVFTVTISVPSVKRTSSLWYVKACVLFWCRYCTLWTQYYSIKNHAVQWLVTCIQTSSKVITGTNLVAITKGLTSALFTHLQNKLDVWKTLVAAGNMLYPYLN